MIIRRENEKDYYEVENLTREAFWNVYRPGCNEHLVLHNARTSDEIVPELNYLIEADEKIVAHILYLKISIRTDDGKNIDALMFGPVSVLPELQRKGYGSKLIKFTLEKAAELGYGAVAITGNPDYYHRFGFESAANYNVYYAGMPRDDEAPFVMIKELKKGYLSGVVGEIIEPKVYSVSDEETDAFDSKFPYKKKEKLPGQLA